MAKYDKYALIEKLTGKIDAIVARDVHEAAEYRNKKAEWDATIKDRLIAAFDVHGVNLWQNSGYGSTPFNELRPPYPPTKGDVSKYKKAIEELTLMVGDVVEVSTRANRS